MNRYVRAFRSALIPAVAATAVLIPASQATAGITPHSVSATTAITSNGEAGYYAGLNGPGHFTMVRTRFFLRVAAEGMGTAGGMGVQLCNDATGRAVQLGVRWDPTQMNFQVLVGSGTLSSTTPNTHGTPCNSGGAFAGVPLSPDLRIPAGHTVKLVLQQLHHAGVYEAFAKDLTDSTSASKSFTSVPFPNEASVGVVQDETSRSAPANILMVRFRNTVLEDSQMEDANLGNTSDWTAVRAFSTANGLVSDPALVNSGPLAAGHFKIDIGGEVS